MPITTDLAGMLDALRGADSFLITTHTSPDGDAVGSMLAMRHLLASMGKKRIDCVLSDPVPQLYRHLPGGSDIVGVEGARGPYDAAVLVDASRRMRAGKAAALLEPPARLLVIDHHDEPEPEGDLVFIDPTYAAVGEIIVRLVETAGLSMSQALAECAYVALVTDTGSFRYANTSPRVHRVAASLVETGLDVAEISMRIFDVLTVGKLGLLQRMLARVTRLHDGMLVYSELLCSDMEETGAGAEDIEGLVNFLRSIDGVHLAILFREFSPDETKINLRARPGVNCAALARRFGGGGHPAAAGATVKQPLDATRAEVLRVSIEALRKSAEPF